MNRNVKWIPVAYLVLGLAGCGLYRWTFAAGLDENSLLVRGSLPEILLWSLTAAALVGAVLACRRCTGAEPGTVCAVVGEVVFATGIFSLLQFPAVGPDLMVKLYHGAAWAAIGCLLVSSGMRILSRRPFFVLLLGPCALCVLQMVECYQLWSEKPMLLDYFFGMGAVLLLTLFAYQKMEFVSGLPGKKIFAFVGILGIFFCCVAAMQVEFPIFFAAGAVWLLAECTALTAPAEG